MRKLGFLLLTLAIFAGAHTGQAADATTLRALYLGGNHTYLGFTYKPEGKGPFPAVVFNQAQTNSKNYGNGDEFLSLSKVFTSRGYVFFVPGRHQPPPWDDEEEKTLSKDDKTIKTHQWHAGNLVAAVNWLKTQIYVDESRVVIMGDSAGAVTTLFAAEDDLNVNGYVLFSPGTQVLRDFPKARAHMKQVVQSARTPMFLIQPENSGSMLPSQILGLEIDKKGVPNRLKVYPAFGDLPSEAQKFAVEGSPVWQRDLFSFIQQVNSPFGAQADAREK